MDWSKQHCGVHRSSYDDMITLMPDIREIIDTFPENPTNFIWDVKVHMLMPKQYPCIPNWHYDNVPRVDGVQDFSLAKLDKPMYLWISGPPLTEFILGGRHFLIEPMEWFKFNQFSKHRGSVSQDFCWRGFIRATHNDIAPPKSDNPLRRHSQVYLDADNFTW